MLLRLLAVLVEQLSFFVVETELRDCAVALRLHGNDQKAAAGFGAVVGLFDLSFRVGRVGVTGKAADDGVRVDKSAAGKLLEALRVNRMVLPMAVSTREEELLG